MTPRQMTEQYAGEAKAAKTGSAEGDALRKLSKVAGVLEEGLISFYVRPASHDDPAHLCSTYLLMLPASCRHPVRLLGSEGTLFPNKQGDYLSGSVKETASMVDVVLTELDPMQHSDQPHKCVAATQSVGRGVYVLYNDGENVRLLYTLFEQELEVSEVSKSDQEHFGVYTIGDSIMKADLDVMAYWNDNFLHKVGYSSYCSRPVQKAALLDCKDTLFTLCGRKPDWEHPSSKVPQGLAQLLNKAAKENPSPQDFRKDMNDVMPETKKPHMDLAAAQTSPETPAESTTKKRVTRSLTVHTGTSGAGKRAAASGLLAMFKPSIPEATFSNMEDAN